MTSSILKVTQFISQLFGQLASRDRDIQLLLEENRLLKHKLYGPKTDRVPEVMDQQLSMFDEPAVEPPAPAEEEQEIRGHKRKKPGRKPLPEDLPREHVYHDIDASEKRCGCGELLVQIGEETSEQLDIVPAKAKVLVHHRIKWACACCEGIETVGGTVKIAPVPPQIIPKSFATPGLLAHIFTAKFVDSLPFYRQEQQLARMGIELKRATMCNWAIQIAQKCQKVTDLLLKKVKQGVYLHIDETTVQVMKEPGRKNRTKSYMWGVP